MHIKLTRLDNSPIWINAAFVVTIEPRRGGGSIVVPIGDGLDYEVRETAEAVLAMLDGAPVPAVVPVPAPKGLAPTAKDVSPETEPPEAVRSEPVRIVLPPPPKVMVSESPAADTSEIPIVEESKPPKRSRRTKKTASENPAETKKTSADEDAGAAKPEADAAAETKPARRPRAKAKKQQVDFPAEQLERLRKMMPGSLRKLLNTLSTQFKIADAESVVAHLQTLGVIAVDREHVIWR